MDMTGEERIAAGREVVWAALNDVEVLRQCIPGCESLEKVSDTDMAARVKLQIGPVRATFSGQVKLSDIDPPNGYRISGEGSGGVAGYARGGAVVRLHDDGPVTVLHYEAKADVGGKLAQLRAQHNLAQAELGEIDPASETIKLATLGMRNIASLLLWEQANYYKKVEDWTSLAATADQITRLQPNFIAVWRFQSWNIAYNVSVEFDDYRSYVPGDDLLVEGPEVLQAAPAARNDQHVGPWYRPVRWQSIEASNRGGYFGCTGLALHPDRP